MSEIKTAIVTGAGSGIGQPTAVALALEGWNVVLVGRTPGKLHESIAWAVKAGADENKLLASPLDITSSGNWHQLMNDAVTHFGRLDALINIAGYASQVPIEMISADEWQKTIDTNVTAVVQMTAAAWPFLKAQGGTIANVSSMASLDPFPMFAMYAAAKAAINMFTLVSAREGADDNINAFAVAPGAVDTPMLRSMFDELQIPKENTLAPEEVAKVIVDCVLGRRAYQPGETIALPSP